MKNPKELEREFKQITETVIETMGLNYDETFAGNRKREYVIARHLAWYFIRDKFGATYVSIGLFFKRNHTTIMYGIKDLNNKLDIGDSFMMQAFNDCCSALRNKPDIDPVFLHNMNHCPTFI